MLLGEVRIFFFYLSVQKGRKVWDFQINLDSWKRVDTIYFKRACSLKVRERMVSSVSVCCVCSGGVCMLHYNWWCWHSLPPCTAQHVWGAVQGDLDEAGGAGKQCLGSQLPLGPPELSTHCRSSIWLLSAKVFYLKLMKSWWQFS